MSAAEVDAAFTKHWKQPCALVIELPERELGGQVIEWEELVQIRDLCDKRGIKLHLDGARIWEIQPYFKRSFQEIASLFDSIYVSFYKGLQGGTGAMLLGSREFMTDARQWQHRMGGRLWQGFTLSLAAERALNANINSFAARGNKLREIVAALMEAQAAFVASKENDMPKVLVRTAAKAKPVAAAPPADTNGAESSESAATSSSSSSSSAIAASSSSPSAAAAVPFQPFFHFVPSVPTCSMVHMYLSGVGQEGAESIRDAVRTEDGISLFTRIRAASKKECYWEWNIGTENATIETQIFVKGWTRFMQRRYQQIKEQMQAQ